MVGLEGGPAHHLNALIEADGPTIVAAERPSSLICPHFPENGMGV